MPTRTVCVCAANNHHFFQWDIDCITNADAVCPYDGSALSQVSETDPIGEF